MGTRIASAIIGLPLVIVAIWVGSPWLSFLVILIAILGYWELHHLISRISAQPPILLGAGWTAALVISGELDERYTLATIIAGLLASLIWAIFKGPVGKSLVTWSVSVAGPLYLGLPLSFALMLRSLEQGREWLLLGRTQGRFPCPESSLDPPEVIFVSWVRTVPSSQELAKSEIGRPCTGCRS